MISSCPSTPTAHPLRRCRSQPANHCRSQPANQLQKWKNHYDFRTQRVQLLEIIGTHCRIQFSILSQLSTDDFCCFHKPSKTSDDTLLRHSQARINKSQLRFIKCLTKAMHEGRLSASHSSSPLQYPCPPFDAAMMNLPQHVFQ